MTSRFRAPPPPSFDEMREVMVAQPQPLRDVPQPPAPVPPPRRLAAGTQECCTPAPSLEERRTFTALFESAQRPCVKAGGAVRPAAPGPAREVVSSAPSAIAAKLFVVPVQKEAWRQQLEVGAGATRKPLQPTNRLKVSKTFRLW